MDALQRWAAPAWLPPPAARLRLCRRCRALTQAQESLGSVTLLDYGAGNVRSVRNAIRKLGYALKEVRWPERIPLLQHLFLNHLVQFVPLSLWLVRPAFSWKTVTTLAVSWELMPGTWRRVQVQKPEDILAADRIVFPGVGAFEQAMGVLARQGYIDPLKEYIQARSYAVQCAEVMQVSSAALRRVSRPG